MGNDQEPLFEFIDQSEFEKAQNKPKPRSSGQGRKQKFDLSNRTLSLWWKLPHKLGFCTVPLHDSIQETLSSDQKAYRQRYPSRTVFWNDPYDVCRDCFMVEADEEARREGLEPVNFGNDTE